MYNQTSPSLYSVSKTWPHRHRIPTRDVVCYWYFLFLSSRRHTVCRCRHTSYRCLYWQNLQLFWKSLLSLQAGQGVGGRRLVWKVGVFISSSLYIFIKTANFCLKLRFSTTYTLNKKARGKFASVSLFLLVYMKLSRFQPHQEKRKRLNYMSL